MRSVYFLSFVILGSFAFSPRYHQVPLLYNGTEAVRKHTDADGDVYPAVFERNVFAERKPIVSWSKPSIGWMLIKFAITLLVAQQSRLFVQARVEFLLKQNLSFYFLLVVKAPIFHKIGLSLSR